MTPEKQIELQKHLEAIAELLYEEADKDKINTITGIEETLRTNGTDLGMVGDAHPTQ